MGKVDAKGENACNRIKMEDLTADPNSYERFNNYYKKNLLKHLPSDKSVKIVDVGCGRGQMLFFLKDNGYTNITGLDLNEDKVGICREMGFEVKVKDVFDYLRSEKDEVDVFILGNFLEHFEYKDIVKILKGLNKLLSSGGKILIITPNCNNIYGVATFNSDITHKSALTEKSINDLVAKTSFEAADFYNLIVYPNVFAVDTLLRLYNLLKIKYSRLMNLVNGQSPYKVQTKNILTILKK